MDELVKMIVAKTGISEAQAKQAVEMVLNFVKSKLPAPIAAQIDGLMGGGGSLGDAAQGLGGLFGKK